MNKMNTPDIKTIISERLQRIIFLSLFAQCVLVTVHVTFQQFLTTADDRSLLSSVVNFRFFLTQFILGLTLSGLTYIHLKNVTVEQVMLHSHLERFKHWSSLKQLGKVFSYCSSGVFYAAFLAVNSSTPCLTDQELYSLFMGATLGVAFYVTYNTNHLYCLEFEPLQQLKVPKLKSKIRSTLTASFVKVTKYLIQFSVVFAFAILTIQWFLPLEKTLCNTSLSPFSITNRIIGLSFLINLSVAFTFLTSLSIMLLITQTLLTEEFTFPVAKLGHCLEDTDQLVCYLAHLDFKQMAMSSPKRRTDLFAISAPGGHPHNWNTISAAAFDTIKQFLLQLNPEHLKNTPPTISPKLQSHLNRSINIRALSSPNSKTSSNGANGTSTTMSDALLKSTKFKFILNIMLPTSLIQYFKNEYPDAKFEEAYNKSQKVIWAVEGLSAAMVASYREDRHGVVQWSLSKMLTMLLDLHVALERFHSRKCRNGNQIKEHRVKAAVVSALYRIVTKFHPYLNVVDFSEEQWIRLRRFKNFCE